MLDEVERGHLTSRLGSVSASSPPGAAGDGGQGSSPLALAPPHHPAGPERGWIMVL